MNDYGKSSVTILQIRAAIKAVNKERSERSFAVSPRKPANSKKAGRVVAASSRNWLATVSHRTLPGSLETQRLYGEFLNDLPAILEKLGLPPQDVQFVEYVKVAMEWLKARA